MANIYFEKNEDQLILHYETDNDWLEKQLDIDYDDIELFKTFKLSARDLISKDIDVRYEYAFSFGVRENNYYRIPKEKICCEFDLYIEHTLSPDQDWFVTTSNAQRKYKDKNGNEKITSIYGNILHAFKSFYKHDKLYIDGDSQSDFIDDGLHVTQSTYEHFVAIFPSATNAKYLKLSIFTNILKNELDVVDYEEIYSKYKAKRIPHHNKSDIFTEKIIERDKEKYMYAKDLLKDALKKIENGEFIHEDDFSKYIAEIFCFLNPKYVKVHTKLNITDYLGARGNCQADLSLIDCEGNIDLIEVKSPKYADLFCKRPYRSHYVPSGELSGAINQLEQYLKCLTKMSPKEIADKNPELQKEFGEIELRAIHPKGYIIFGRDSASFVGENQKQKESDFEIIKNTYNDIVDIITFDDLVRRFERLIDFLDTK